MSKSKIFQEGAEQIQKFTLKGSKKIAGLAKDLPEGLLKQKLVSSGAKLNKTGTLVRGVNDRIDTKRIGDAINSARRELKASKNAFSRVAETLDVDEASAKSIVRNLEKRGLTREQIAKKAINMNTIGGSEKISDIAGDIPEGLLKKELKRNGAKVTDDGVVLGLNNKKRTDIIDKAKTSANQKLSATARPTQQVADGLSVDQSTAKSITRHYKKHGVASGDEILDSEVRQRIANETRKISDPSADAEAIKDAIRAEKANKAQGGIDADDIKDAIRADRNNASLEIDENKLYKNRYSSKDAYMKHKTAAKFKEAREAFINKDYNSELLKALTDDGYDVQNLSLKQFDDIRSNAVNRASGKDMGLMDTMGYYRAPQKATGIAATLWTLQKLGGTGPKTNQQLYGQTQY